VDKINYFEILTPCCTPQNSPSLEKPKVSMRLMEKSW